MGEGEFAGADLDGVVVECNVRKGEMVVDNTVNLFQIADVSRLQVIAELSRGCLADLGGPPRQPEAVDRPNRGHLNSNGTCRNDRRNWLHDRPQPAHGDHQGVCRQPRPKDSGRAIRYGHGEHPAAR